MSLRHEWHDTICGSVYLSTAFLFVYCALDHFDTHVYLSMYMCITLFCWGAYGYILGTQFKFDICV